MKKIFNFAKKKKSSTGTPDNASLLSVGYELKDKDLGKVHKAASLGDLAKLKQLAAKQKNDLNQLDKENRTALHIACAAGHVEVVQFLAESKAKLNLCDNQNRSALMKAVQGQHENCVGILLENHADPNLVDINGNTALHLASNIPSVSTAGLLLEHEANINAPNKEGLTPLGVAVREDHIEMAEFLLKEGADVNATDDDKRTALMMAAGNGQIAMLRLLLRNEADITLKDDKGWSADDYAVMNGHHPCSLLIIEHGTQKSDGASSLHQDQGKKKKKLSAASHHTEAGFSLGGPAIDKDDFQDNSQSESLSRVSKSGADDWPSSDNDDESPTIQKKSKRFSLNLREMIASKTGGASAQLDTSLSGVESEPESDTAPYAAPSQSLLKALPSSSSPLRPIDPRPESLPFKPPRMTSTPLPSSQKKEISTDDDSEEDVLDQKEHEEEEEGEEELGESEHSLDAASTIPESETSKDKKRDFMSELGLEKEEPVQDSWDSESDLDDINLQKKENEMVHEETMSTVKEEMEEIGSNGNDEGARNDHGESTQKETKWGPLLNKCEATVDQKTDLMEELGLGDADDLEDASDWDSASTTSKLTLPGGRRMPSPGIEEFPESPEPPNEKTKARAPVTPQRSFNSSSQSTLSRSAPPHPQPRVRKMTPRKSDSQEDSDCDSEQQRDNHMMETVYQQALNEPDSPELKPPRTSESAGSEPEEEEQPVERDTDVVDVGELAIDTPHPSEHPIYESDITYPTRDQDDSKDHAEPTDTVPWENRYEKIWVEVEKREVKTSYKSVAAELKARFGEIFKSRQRDTDGSEEEEDAAEHAPETSSDEDEGEVIVRPIARARQTTRLSAILEQRESGLEDSVSESAETSVCEQECEDPIYGNSPEPEQEPQDVPHEEELSQYSPQPRNIQDKNEDGNFSQLVSQNRPAPSAEDMSSSSSHPSLEVAALEDATKQDFDEDGSLPDSELEEVRTERNGISTHKIFSPASTKGASSSSSDQCLGATAMEDASKEDGEVDSSLLKEEFEDVHTESGGNPMHKTSYPASIEEASSSSSQQSLEVCAPEDCAKQDFEVDSSIPDDEVREVCTESSRILGNSTSFPANSSSATKQKEHGTVIAVRDFPKDTKPKSNIISRSLSDSEAITKNDMSSQDRASPINRRSPIPEEGCDINAFTSTTKPNFKAENVSIDNDEEEESEEAFSQELNLVSQDIPPENLCKTSSPPPMEATDANGAFNTKSEFEDDSMKPLDDKVDDAHVSSEEENPDGDEPRRQSTLSKRSVSVAGVSDEELEEDMERFKMEVGMLKVVFRDLEREKAQLQTEARKLGKASNTDRAAAEEEQQQQRLSASRDRCGKPAEDVGSEKPEIEVREKLATQAAPPEHKPVDSKRTNGAPAKSHFSLQPLNSSSRKDTQESKQQDVVRGPHRHVNGNPLSVFDDSSLSDVSDAEGRMPKEGKKNENPEEVDMAEDFDDLTQSSDTATDELDSPSAGYRHAALLVEKLDSTSLDSRNMVKLQNIFHEYERTIQKLKSRHSYLSDKVNQLEMEKVDMKNSLEEMKDVKPTLERNQLELQTEVTNLKFQLKQEQENRRNATMMYNTTKDKLKRTEEQHQLEIQEKQKVELTLRNLELEMRTLVNNMKQLEEDHSTTQRLLVQERSARSLQEDLLNSHLRKQQEIEEENKRNISKSNEALSQLTEASDREKELLQQTTTLQEQITILRGDLERSQANSSLKESHLLEENETLKEQLEDARREVKANSEALTQTVFNCNNQLTTLKSELVIMTNRFENEKQGRETLEKEVDSTRTRLTGAVQEAERCMAANADTEKALLREKEESQRLKDRHTAESANNREAVSSLSQKLSKAESDANSLENEVHRVTLQLTEKGLLLDVLQKEKDQLAAQFKELDKSLQAQKDLATKTGARHEATQERLAQAQSEGMLLRQQLEEANNKGEVKEKAVTDAQERFSDMLSKLRSDCEERVTLVEERNKELASKAADLRDQVFKLEEEKNEREASLRQLQQELADSLKRLSMSEASLEVNTRYRSDLEEEKARTFKDLDRLKEKLAETEDQYVQAEKRFNSLKSSFDEKEKELAFTTQRLQEALSAASASAATMKQLEEAVQRLEIENAKLEATAKQQSNKIEALQKGAQEAVMVRGHLEELVTNLQSSKMSLEDQLSREVQKQSMLSHTAQDSQALWEQEVKSRSKLGLRLSELEKEKGELTSQMEIEKKKAKKITEQKKAVDARLDQEMNRNSELQKEMYRLRNLLKTAKKKLRDQDMGGEFNSPMNSLRMDMSRLNQDPRKADELQAQLERETSRRSQLEKDNNDLREELSSLKRGQSGQKLQEEMLELRRQMESSQSQAEERARHELQHKLEQVNLFLQTQAASQEALDQIKAANQASLRSQLEQRIRELESEVSRARSTQQDSLSQRDSTRTELDRYRGMYSEELRLRKSLAAKLERANTRLSDANSKLVSERSRSLIAGSFMGGSLDGATLSSSTGNLGLNRTLGLSLLSPVSGGQSTRVEDYLTKMQSELDRNISKELSSATAELDLASARLSPVGSASLDPVSRATQQYLEVLKKNHRI